MNKQFRANIFVVLIALPLVIVPTVTTANTDLLSIYPKASVFKHSVKSYQSYPLIEGPISYIANHEEEIVEGYAPEKETEISGQLEKTVFDHTEHDSALEIAENMRSEMDKKSFDILYECSGEACGDVAGWKLFLDKYVDGSPDRQHYILAKHSAKNGGEWVVAFYVNEFSGRPRSVMHVINTQDVAFDHYVIRESALGIKLAAGEKVTLDGLLFDFDSHLISQPSIDILSELVTSLQSHPQMHISVEGHTDDVGSAIYNKQLSLLRAESVRDFLVEHGIDETRISTQGFGEEKPVVPGTDSSARRQNRRVEVVRIDVGKDNLASNE